MVQYYSLYIPKTSPALLCFFETLAVPVFWSTDADAAWYIFSSAFVLRHPDR
ncbi:MAG: hypothetical protein JST22_10025 [Bacteroidetes bacterium]|nr:hypothetical protein [Bacteroidota bacterium]